MHSHIGVIDDLSKNLTDILTVFRRNFNKNSQKVVGQIVGQMQPYGGICTQTPNSTCTIHCGF